MSFLGGGAYSYENIGLVAFIDELAQEMKAFTAVWIAFFTFLTLLIGYNEGGTPGHKLCANPDCSEPISRAKTLLRYVSVDKDRVSFKPGMDVDVFIKRGDTWGIKVGDRFGFAPATFLKEFKILVSSKSLYNIPENEAVEPGTPEPVKIETTKRDSVDAAVEKTEEIPASVGSLLNFPSVAAAENVEVQQGSLPTPSSPQYEMVDGTTIWFDPVPATQPNIPYTSGKNEAEPQSAENVSEAVPDTLLNPVVSPDQSAEAVSEPSSAPSPIIPQNTEVKIDPPPTEVPVTPIPEDNSGTPPSFADGPPEAPLQETSTEATTEPSQEVTTETSLDVSAEAVTTEATPAGVTEAVNETPETITEGQTIEPTEASIMTNIWNTMFNSGDGTEENSQENDGEDPEEDDGEEEGDDEDGADDDEADVEENSTEPSTPIPQSSDAGAAATVESTSVPPASGEDVVKNVVVENIPVSTTASPEELAASFPQAQVENLDDGTRIPRQTESFSGEVTVEQEKGGAQVSGEEVETASSENVLDQDQVSGSVGSITQDAQQADEREKKRALEEEQKRKEDEILRQQEEEKKQQQELENQRQQEEEAKRQQEEEAKRLHEEEEAKRQLEEQMKRQQEEEAMRQQEEEVKRQQEEEIKRQQEEEIKRQQEEAIKRQQEEEAKRQQEEVARMQALEEENQKSLAAEQELRRQNEEIQRLQEEEMMRQRDEAHQKQIQEALERENEKNKLIEETSQSTVGSMLNESISESETSNTEPASPSVEPETPSAGMFSWFGGMFGSSADTENTEPETSNQEPQPQDSQAQHEAHPTMVPSPESHHHHDHLHEHPPVWSSEQQTMCSADGGCEMAAPEVEEAGGLFGIQTPSLDVILLRLAATALALFMGAVSFYFLRKKHVDSILVAKINELEKQLLVASKEAVILREEQVTVNSSVNDEEVNSLREELESSRLVRADLEEQVSTLERELEEATETGIELNKLLSETLEASKGKAHAGLAASVERLQQQLDSQKDKVDSLTRSLKSTSGENENLKSLVVESKERISALEAELTAAAEIANNIRREKEEANVLLAQELQQVQSRLEEALSSKVLEESRLGSELSALKLKHETLRSSLSMKDAEVKALQDTLKQLESGGGNQLLDITKVKAEIEHTKSERDLFLAKYEEEEKGRKDLEVRLDKITETLKILEEKADVADKGREEAETRLAVLSNYFKEKEEQLQKELGLKEAIVAQHRGDESTVVKHLQLLQEEVNTYKAQNESLKQEILDQERDFKGQIATLEKKAHDNWMTARQAERRLEDSRQEAAQLRNRLTIVEKSNADPNTRLDANGDGGVASPVMMMPLPPLGDMETPPPLPPFMFSPPPYPPPFMPPPLPPHPMGRPPPLGRMSSPPPPLGQFSPPPPPYDRLDRLDRSSRSRSPSPPPHHRYHHRSPPPPQQWDAPPSSFRPVPKPSPKKPSDQRDHKGPMHTSGHMNDSTDKSREHV